MCRKFHSYDLKTMGRNCSLRHKYFTNRPEPLTPTVCWLQYICPNIVSLVQSRIKNKPILLTHLGSLGLFKLLSRLTCYVIGDKGDDVVYKGHSFERPKDDIYNHICHSHFSKFSYYWCWYVTASYWKYTNVQLEIIPLKQLWTSVNPLSCTSPGCI